MKFVIVLAALFAVALARPDAEIVRHTSEVLADHFKFDVATSDGFAHNADGQLKDAGTDHESIVVHGSYEFVGDDGKTYTVKYTADENGFQPTGDHLPVA